MALVQKKLPVCILIVFMSIGMLGSAFSMFVYHKETNGSSNNSTYGLRAYTSYESSHAMISNRKNHKGISTEAPGKNNDLCLSQFSSLPFRIPIRIRTLVFLGLLGLSAFTTIPIFKDIAFIIVAIPIALLIIGPYIVQSVIGLFTKE